MKSAEDKIKIVRTGLTGIVLALAFCMNSLGATKWVWATAYGNGDTDAHYDAFAKTNGNGGVTIRVTSHANGGSETTSLVTINGYYLVKMKVGPSGSWYTVNFSGDNNTQGQWQIGGDYGTDYDKAITHAQLSSTTGYAEANDSELYFKVVCNSSCSAGNEIEVTRPDGNAHLDFDVVAPTLSSVTIASNNSNPYEQYARKDDTITLTYTSSETINSPTTVTIAGQAADATNSSGNDWTSTYVVTTDATEGNAAISIAFTDDMGNAGTTVTTIDNCTN